MRLITIIATLAFIAFGAVFSVLNAGIVHYELGVTAVDLPKGVALLTALALGWLLGGLSAWLGLRMRRRGQERRTASADDT